MFEGTDNVSKVIDGISGKLDSFGAEVGRVTQPLADLAATVLKVEAALAALAVGGLVLAFNESKKFEAALLELQKVLGDESGRLDEAKQSAIGLSDQYGESSTKIVGAMAEWKQAGYDLNDSMLLTKDTMDLVIAGNLEAGEASEYLIGILKGFVAPAGEARHAIDVLNEVSNNYGTNVRELGIGMSQLAPIARLMGMDFEQTAGVLTPIIEIFRSGSVAADALKTALARMVDDRKPTIDTLTAIGVSQKDLNGNLKSGYDILLEVAAAFEKLTPEQQFYHAQNLVGIEQAGRLVAVLSNLDNALEVTRVAYGAQGSALAEVQIRLASAEVAVNRFISAAQNLAIAVGDQFRLAAVEAIKGGTDIEIALRNMVNAGTFAPIFDLIKEFATNLGADLKVIAQNLPEAFAGIDWSNLIASMRNVGGSIVGLFEAAFGDVDLTTVEGLRSAIQRVVDGVAALTNVTAGILESWRPFVAAIAEAAERFSQTSEGTQTFAGNILGLGQAINSIVNNFDILTGALTVLSGAMSVLAGTSLINAVGGFGSLATAIGSAAAALGPFQAAAAALGAGWVLDKVLDATVPKWEANKQAIADNIAAMHGADVGLDTLEASVEDTGKVVAQQKSIWDELNEAIDAIPEQATTEIEAKGAELTKEEIDGIVKAFAEIGEEKTIEVTAKADEAAIEKVGNIIVQTFPDGRVVLVQTNADQAALEKTKSAIDSKLPEEKIMEIKLQGEIDVQLEKIKAQAQNLDSYFEYKAKVDVAEIEQVFETIRNQSNNITEMFKNTGDVLSDLAGSLGDIGAIGRLEIFELMEEESRRRDALLLEQQKLTEAQIKYLDARSKAMAAGQGIITIQADGLAPELELVLHKIIELTQIRANAEGLNFLLGVS